MVCISVANLLFSPYHYDPGIVPNHRCGTYLGSRWSRLHVVFHCDNSAAVTIFTSTSSWNPGAVHLIRRLTLAACKHHFSLPARHFSGHSNTADDALSRFHFQTFRHLLPDANVSLTPVPSDLLSQLRYST